MKKLAFVFCLGAQFFIYGNADAQTHLKIIQQNGKFGLSERGEKGKIVLPAEYSRLDKFNDGYALVTKDGKMGMIDTMGRIVVPTTYKSIGNFRNGLALVQDQNNKFGYMGPKGKIVIEPVYDKAGEFYDAKTGKNREIALVVKNGKSGLLATTGKYVLEPEYDEIREYSEGLAAVRKENKIGFIDVNGKVVIEPTFAIAEDFKNARAKFTNDSTHWGYIDRTGKAVIEPIYEEITELSEGIAAFKEKGKWGFIDAGGRIIAKPEFTEVEPFTEGYAVVFYGQKQYKGKFTSNDRVLKTLTKDELSKPGYGYLSKDGSVFLGPYFEKANSFKNGVAVVTLKNGTDGYIDKQGVFNSFRKRR